MTLLKEETYGTVKAYFLSSAVWFVIGTSIGFIDATHLVAPDLLGNISWLVFGRTRAMHTNLVIFGFVGTALLGSAFYLVPTLLQAPLLQRAIGKAFPLDPESDHSLRNRHPRPGVFPGPGIRRMDLAGGYGGPDHLCLDFLYLFSGRLECAGKRPCMFPSGISSPA